jgi:hypothetical protein
MFGHISCEDAAKESLVEYFKVLSAKFTQEIRFRIHHQLESLSCMVVLLNALGVVSYGPGGKGISVVGIV